MNASKTIIFFIIRYIGLYLILNTIYALFVNSYYPSADPLTIFVTENTALLLQLVESNVTVSTFDNYAMVPMLADGKTIIEVYEGCNSVNVIIVYLSFIVAFKGDAKSFAIFASVGSIFIYLINLLRIVGLFLVARYYPEHLYFFHKFLFTAIIYAWVFGIWYLWVNHLKKT